MSMFDDNNKNKRNSLGDDIFDGIGSAYPFAKNLSEKITGHTVEGDMKMLKGFSDSEFAGMSVEQLMKLKRTYRSRTVLFLFLSVSMIIGGILSVFKGELTTTIIGITFGVCLFLLSKKSKQQCSLIQKYLDVDK